MRKGVYLLLLITAAAFGSQPAKSQEDDFLKTLQAKQKAAVGQPFPGFSVQSMDTVVTQEALRGRVVFSNFWFKACAPCVAEFEGLNELYQRVKEEVVFLSFTFETPATVKAVREKYGFRYPVLSVSEEECRRLNQNFGFPTTMVLNREGNIAYLHVGGSARKKEARAWVRKAYFTRLRQALDNLPRQ